MSLFRPLLAGAHLGERLLACGGAAIGIALTMVVSAWLPIGVTDIPIIVAPLGASAVLIFAVPSSPLAQPWPVVGGNIISTLVGVTAFQTIAQPALAAGLAVGGAILVMSLLRSPGSSSSALAFDVPRNESTLENS